jgi:oxygen-independent coproporphyrinogen-3 oxidase
MQNRCQDRLAKAGFEHYEVSAFARHGMRCNHNLNYWSFGDYLGIGAGAHAKLTDPTHRLIKRIVKQKHPRQYLVCIESSDFVMSEVLVSREEIPLEFMLNALRLKDGFSVQQYEATTSMPIDAIEDCLHQAEQRGLLARTSSTIRPTALGQRFLNELLLIFYPDSANKKPGVKPRGQTSVSSPAPHVRPEVNFSP